ncbi:DUF4373 domain-containing protein [Collinsella sp. BA40]|uniref:DUF4373 domain-containing protein n=1 Tax=Collinsella sp. BA40 TaxID=2560852 RepID=UPI0011C8FC0A|nr:DUF4373 domain-containing protein [Collinsella sp. BA40]TXF39053.1 DUF4373 domain-containing protein [Collinsella sp. BA40]
MASQLEFVPIDIDMADDPKVSYLMDTVGAGDAAARFAAYGRLVLVMQRVYHDGFYLSYGKFERIKLAKDAGMSADELDGFIESCIDAELFDEGMFREHGVLTSRGIQARYFRARKTKAVADEDAPFVLGSAAPERVREDELRDSPKSSENRREVPKSSEIRRKAPKNAEPSEEKRRRSKEKSSEGKTRGAAARAASSSSGDSGGFASVAAGAFPLACLSAVSDPAGGYFDSAGAVHDTPWGAIEATYTDRTGGGNVRTFAMQVASLCPKGCDCSLERVEGCARLIMRSLERFDPAKGASPFPLAKKIIQDERGAA